jgi:hypothetical protein
MEKLLITVPDFLRQYAISRTSFYKEVKDGRLRIIKRGRRTVVSNLDASQWLESLRNQSGATSIKQ